MTTPPTDPSRRAVEDAKAASDETEELIRQAREVLDEHKAERRQNNFTPLLLEAFRRKSRVQRTRRPTG